MDLIFRDQFITLWERYFAGAELPLAALYADEPGALKVAPPPGRHKCLICELMRARRGEDLCFDASGIGCYGGKRYLGFSTEVMPGFEYFLSTGIPGQLEGEHYKQSPELVRELVGQTPAFTTPGRYFIAKRWDRLTADDDPRVVIFFATPDVLSGLFTLANYDEDGPSVVQAPFGAGCAAIIQTPWLENDAERPRCVLGLFDPSARKCVPADRLSFAVPLRKFTRMVANMEQSFLTTGSWALLHRRIEKAQHK